MNYLDPAEYGVDRKKHNLYQFPIDARTPPFLEEPPALETPSAITAPPALDTPKLPGRWTSQDQAAEMDRGSDAALERYKELAAKPPKLEYKKGALGVLQRIGDAVVRPDVMHPNFTRETENYNRDLDAQGKVVKAAGSMADDARQRALYERQMETAGKQGKLYERQTARLEQPDPVKWKYNAHTGMYEDDFGNTKPGPPQLKVPTEKETPEQATARRTKEADQYGLKGDARTNYILTGKIPQPKRGSDGPKPASPKDFNAVQSERMRLDTAANQEADRRKDKLKKDNTVPGPGGKMIVNWDAINDELKAIDDEREAQKRRNEEQYYSKIETLGGTVAPRAASATVKLQAPDGSISEVPADQADHYIKLGAKRL